MVFFFLITAVIKLNKGNHLKIICKSNINWTVSVIENAEAGGLQLRDHPGQLSKTVLK